MKQTLLCISALLWCEAHAAAQDKEEKSELKVRKDIQSYEGTSLLTFGPGVLNSSRYAVFRKMKPRKEGDDISDDTFYFEIKGRDMEKMHKWLNEHIAPLLALGKSPPRSAYIVPWTLTLFSSEGIDSKFTLVQISLADVFENFSHEKFDQLVKELGATALPPRSQN